MARADRRCREFLGVDGQLRGDVGGKFLREDVWAGEWREGKGEDDWGVEGEDQG